MTGKRGRPVGSLGRKKREELAASQSQLSTQATSPSHLTTRAYHQGREEEAIFEDEENFSFDEEEGEELSEKLEKAVEKAIGALSSDLRSLKRDLKEELKSHVRRIRKLEKANEELRETCTTLNEKVAKLEKENAEQYALLNKQERFSRRNNIRLVGYKTAENEDCTEIAKSTFAEIGVQDCKIERAHRDGKVVLLPRQTISSTPCKEQITG